MKTATKLAQYLEGIHHAEADLKSDWMPNGVAGDPSQRDVLMQHLKVQVGGSLAWREGYAWRATLKQKNFKSLAPKPEDGDFDNDPEPFTAEFAYHGYSSAITDEDAYAFDRHIATRSHRPISKLSRVALWWLMHCQRYENYQDIEAAESAAGWDPTP